MDEWTLNDLLECSVCLERLDTSSKVLPCQHTFCKKCLEEILATHKELRCPECRVLIDVKIDELPPNVLLMRILEGMRNAAPKKRHSGGGSLSAHHTPSRLPLAVGSSQQPSSLPLLQHHPQGQHMMMSRFALPSTIIMPPSVPTLNAKAANFHMPQPPPSVMKTAAGVIQTSQLPNSPPQYPGPQPHSLVISPSYIRLDHTSTLPTSSTDPPISRHVDQVATLPTTHITVQSYASSSDHTVSTTSPATTSIAAHHRTPPPPQLSSGIDVTSSVSPRTSHSTTSHPSQDQSSRLPVHVPNKVTGQPCARAVYDYRSKLPGDLSFKEGDLIKLRRKIDSNWYHGECHGNMGVFPLSYVQILTPLPGQVPQCKALYDFRMSNDEEDGCLTFNKGEIINVIRRVDENWAEGKLGERIGIFPLAFVELNSVGRALMKLSSNSQPGPSRVAPPTPTTEDSTPLIPTDHSRAVATTHASNTHQSMGSDSSSSTTLTSPSSSSSSSTTPPTSSSSTAPSSPTSPPQQPPTSTASHPLPHSHHKRHSFTALQHPTQSQNTNRHSAEIMTSGDAPSSECSSSGPQSLQVTSTTSSGNHDVSPSCLQRSGSKRHHRTTPAANPEDLPPPPAPPTDFAFPVHHSLQLPALYVALYPYKPQKSDELELKKGGVYTVTERCQDGWFKGTNKSQKCGVFPGNYVAPARSLPALQAQLRGLGRTSGTTRNLQAQLPPPEPRSYTRPSNSSRHLVPPGGTNPPELPPRSISPGGHACMPSSWHGDMSGSGVNPTRTHPVPGMTTSGPVGSSSKQDSPGRNTPLVDGTSVVGPPNVSVSSSTSIPSPASSTKSHEKGKEKKDRSGGGVGLMKKHFFSIKKSKSPPPVTYSMDNPVFEDGTSTSASSVSPMSPSSLVGQPHVAIVHPIHVRSGSCPSQLLQVLPLDGVGGGSGHVMSSPHHISSHSHHRLFSPSTSQRSKHKERPSLNVAHFSRSGETGSPVPMGAAQHRKSNSLDAGALVGGSESRKSKQLVPVVKERFRCIVPYPPNSEYELELQIGDVIYVHKKREDGWYKGTQQRTGRTGLFPASFVETF